MNTQVIIIVNPFCHQGLGWQRWLSIKDDVMKLFPENTITIVIEKGMQFKEVIATLIANSNENYIISAGGDGSMNYLIHTLFQIPNVNLNKITLGAIGLGSSNDFLKPNNQLIKGIPVRINYRSSKLGYDVGLVKFNDENKEDQLRYFIVNSSFGVTAQANYNFNNPDKILKFLKLKFTSSAILYAAISTIIRYKNFPCQLYFNGNFQNIEVSNINILKIPYVSGSFHYNQEIKPNDGKLALNICMNMTKSELLYSLIQLASGKFKNNKKRTSQYVTEFTLDAVKPVVFEYDGETIKSKHVAITIHPKKIKILTN